MCANRSRARGWVSLGLKKSVFSFLSREMMQGPSGFISHNSVHGKHVPNGQTSRFWKDRGPECHPHLQTKPLPENPPLMKWAGQCNNAWAKHLLADYYYLVNKATKRMRMPHYMSDYLLDYFCRSMKQISHPSVFLLFSLWKKEAVKQRWELKPISKQRNERQAKLRKEWAPFNSIWLSIFKAIVKPSFYWWVTEFHDYIFHIKSFEKSLQSNNKNKPT